jgi:putative ABC transport system permease protein
MSLWKIAWRSIQQRSLASLLTTISMALGVMLVVAVLVIYNVVHQAFHRGGEGYDLIIGPPKGSNLELVLSSVFYIGQPMTTLPYGVYLDLYQNRIGGNWVRDAVPICLGDNYEDKRVVGTTSGMFDLKDSDDRQIFQFADGKAFEDDERGWFTAVAGATAARQVGLKVGGKFRPTHDAAGGAGHKHGEFEVVGILKPTGSPNDNVLFVNIEGFYRVGGHAGRVGMALTEAKTTAAPPATKHGSKPADEPRDMSAGSTGFSRNPGGKEVGVPPSGGPAKGAKPPEGGTPVAKPDEDHDEDEHLHQPIPDSAKQVSAVLVCTRDAAETLPLATEINKGKEAQAAVPAKEINNLFEKIVGNIEIVLLVFAIMIVLVAGIGIMVSIYNSMNDRRHEIAIMRALGARRSTVMVVILLESILLSLGGGVLGLTMGHSLLALAGPWIAERVNLPLSMLNFRAAELILVPGLIVLASIVGYLPALAAYRTDVGKSLVANP